MEADKLSLKMTNPQQYSLSLSMGGEKGFLDFLYNPT